MDAVFSRASASGTFTTQFSAPACDASVDASSMLARTSHSGRGDAANRSLLPDGLHPTVAGYALLLRCWEREIAALAARSRDGRRPRRR